MGTAAQRERRRIAKSAGQAPAIEPTVIDFAAILRGRRRTPGRLYPHAGKSAILDSMAYMVPMIDAAQCCATATISTPTPDRSEDVVMPLGCRLDNYRANPVVYFDHGFSGLSMPIAKSEDPNGNCTVVISDDGIEATSYFSQSCFEAMQIFELIAEKIIRTASINLAPIVAKVRSEGTGFRPGLLVEEWELLEWSWVGVPDNPEALRKILDRGKLAGKSICEPILKSLQPQAAGVQAIGIGWIQPPEQSQVSITPTAAVVPAVTLPKSLAKAAGDAPPPDDTAMADDPMAADDTGEEVDGETPLGAQVLAAAYDALSGIVQQIQSSLGPLENPPVKEYLAALVETLNGHLAEVEGAYSSNYPDAAELTKTDSADDPNADPEADSMAKFLRRDQNNRLQLSGLGHRLKSVATAKNLTKAQREAISLVSLRFAKMLAKAKEPPAEPKAADPDPALVEQFNEIKTTFTTLTKTLESIAPHRRAS